MPAEACGLDLLRAIVRSSESAARLAARFEQSCGGPQHVEEALAGALATLRCHAAAAASPGHLAADLKRAVRDDFAAGRVVLLDGWMLTRTELALCCAAAGTLPVDTGSAPS